MGQIVLGQGRRGLGIEAHARLGREGERWGSLDGEGAAGEAVPGKKSHAQGCSPALEREGGGTSMHRPGHGHCLWAGMALGDVFFRLLPSPQWKRRQGHCLGDGKEWEGVGMAGG